MTVWRKYSSVLLAGGAVLLFVAVLVVPGRQMAEQHVRRISGGPSLSTNCLSCHAYMELDGPLEPVLSPVLEADYRTPRDLTVSPDGKTLYVVAEDTEQLLVVSTRMGVVTDRVPLGDYPHSVVVDQTGATGYVSNLWSDHVSVIDLQEGRVTDTLETGAGPSGLELGPEERYLYVANQYSDDCSVIDLRKREEMNRLATGHRPLEAKRSPDGSRVLVTSRKTRATTPSREPPETEITVIDTKTHQVAERKLFRGAQLLEGIDFIPGSDRALVTLTRPTQLLPTTQVGRGWMFTFGLGLFSADGNRPPVQLLLDGVNRFYPNPFDVVVAPDGKRAFVTHEGTDVISVVNLATFRSVAERARPDSLAYAANHLGMSSEYVTKRIPTGANPRRMVLSPDGSKLYVAERLRDRILVIDIDHLTRVRTIDLEGPEAVTTLRRGERLFHRARGFQQQFSCRTCHPGYGEDGLMWDFAEPRGLGRNMLNTISLRDVDGTSPFKWTGTNTSLYMQDGIRFAKHVTRATPYSESELKALVAYIHNIPPRPNRQKAPDDSLNPIEQEGKSLFTRVKTEDGKLIPQENRCTTCHPPPLYTNRQTADVGTGRETDDKSEFNSPSLRNIWATAPYLHDGSASTLEEIWTKNSLNDEHGVVSDLDQRQLNNLVEYLKTIGSSEQQ